MKQLWLILCLCMGAGAYMVGRVPSALAAPIVLLVSVAVFLWKKKSYTLYPVAVLAIFFAASSTFSSANGQSHRVAVEGVVIVSKEQYYDLRAGLFKKVRVFSQRQPTEGTTMAVRGQRMREEAPKNPGDFDGRYYALAHGIDATVRPTKETIRPEKGTVLEKIYAFRGRFRKMGNERMRRYFRPKEAKLLSAMLFGNDADWEGLEDFRTLNILHILSISGLHIGLILSGLVGALKKLTVPYDGRKVSVHLLLLAYLFLTGFPVGGMRVWLSLLFTDVGKRMRRPVDPNYAWAFSGAIFLAANPFFIYRLGFLFSFFSVWGILTVYPKLPLFSESRAPLMASLGVSIAVTLAIAPLLLYTSGGISLTGLLANVILLPLASVILYGGVAVSALSFFLPPLAAGAAVVTQWVFVPFFFFTEHLAAMPFRRVLPSFSVAEACAYYGVLYLALKFPFSRLRRKAGRLLLIQALFAGCIVVGWSYFLRPDLSVTQLYVGQGDCAYVEGKDFRGLIDTGGSRLGGDPTARYVVPFLRTKGVGTLDGVFLSHYDADHAGGVFTLAKTYKIKGIYAPAPGSAEDRAMYEEIVEKVGEIRSIQGVFPMKGWKMKIFPPYGKEGNALSMAMELSSDGGRVLFLGDLPKEQEKRLLKDLDGEETVVKLAHHGSKTSSCDEFLEAVRPRLALISAGENNAYGHPHKEVLRRLKAHRIPYVQTKDGAITISFQRGKVRLSVFHPETLSMRQGIFFVVSMVGLVGVGYLGANYFKKRDDRWNQWITMEPIFCGDRKSSVWKKSANK